MVLHSILMWLLYNCTDSRTIRERKSAISQLWTSLRETINMRSMAFAVAKEIHTFDRDAVDTKERIQVLHCKQ